MAKTNKEFEGMRITLLDGSKSRISKVMKNGYKTEDGDTIAATNVSKKGRGLVEIDSGGAAKPKPSRRRRNEKATSKKATSKKATSKKAPKDPDTMLRKDLVTALIDAEVFETRSDARGVGVPELRKKLTRVLKKGTKKPAKAKEEKVQRRGKPEKVEKSKQKLKAVKRMTDKITAHIEGVMQESFPDWLRRKTGLDLTVACVAGVFTDERLTIQAGLLPSDATDEDIAAYSADMEKAELAAVEGGDEGDQDRGEIIAELSEITGVKKKKIALLVDAWFENFDEAIEPKLGDEVQLGTRLDRDDEEAIVVGFSEEKGKIALYLTDEDKVILTTAEKIARMDILEEADADEEGEEEEFDEEEDGEDEDGEDEDGEDEDEGDEDEGDEDEEDEDGEDEDEGDEDEDGESDGFDDFDDDDL